MNTLEILTAVRKLIETPETWTTEYLAIDNNGNPVSPLMPEAVKFCLLGALFHTDDPINEGHKALRDELTETKSLANFNDNHSHEEVLALVDKAIIKVGGANA